MGHTTLGVSCEFVDYNQTVNELLKMSCHGGSDTPADSVPSVPEERKIPSVPITVHPPSPSPQPTVISKPVPILVVSEAPEMRAISFPTTTSSESLRVSVPASLPAPTPKPDLATQFPCIFSTSIILSAIDTFQHEDSEAQKMPSRAESAMRGPDPLAQLGRGDSAFKLINAGDESRYLSSLETLLNPPRQSTIQDASKLLEGELEEKKKEEPKAVAAETASSFLAEFVASRFFAKSDVVPAAIVKKGNIGAGGKGTIYI